MFAVLDHLFEFLMSGLSVGVILAQYLFPLGKHLMQQFFSFRVLTLGCDYPREHMTGGQSQRMILTEHSLTTDKDLPVQLLSLAIASLQTGHVCKAVAGLKSGGMLVADRLLLVGN